MGFSVDDDKVEYRISDILVALESGTVDNPETVWSTQHKLHSLPHAWNPDTLAYEPLPLTSSIPEIAGPGLSVRQVPGSIRDFAGRSSFNTVFGEAAVGFHRDDVSVQFQYNNSTRDVTPTVSGSGTTSNNGAEKAVVAITTTAGDARLQSVDAIRYRPGHEALAQFTSVYVGAQAGVNQYHGILNTVDGATFGTKDGVFGCWFIEGGSEVFYPQSEWLGDDKLDGNGATGFNLDPTMMNIYMISYGWLGIAPVLFSVYAGREHGWRLVHWVDRANLADAPHLGNPSLPIGMRVVRASGTGTAANISSSSWRAGVTGGEEEDNAANRWFSQTTLDASVSALPTRNNVFSIINNATFQGKTNHVVIELGIVTFANDTNKTVAFYGTKGAIGTVVTGGAAPVSKDATNSVTSIRVGGTITGGTQGPATVVRSGQDRRTDVRDTGIRIYPGEEFAFEATGGAGLTGTVSLSARWVEKF